MKIDIRWIILVAGVAGATWLVKEKTDWATPVTVAVAVGALLLAVLWRRRPE